MRPGLEGSLSGQLQGREMNGEGREFTARLGFT